MESVNTRLIKINAKVNSSFVQRNNNKLNKKNIVESIQKNISKIFFMRSMYISDTSVVKRPKRIEGHANNLIQNKKFVKTMDMLKLKICWNLGIIFNLG